MVVSLRFFSAHPQPSLFPARVPGSLTPTMEQGFLPWGLCFCVHPRGSLCLRLAPPPRFCWRFCFQVVVGPDPLGVPKADTRFSAAHHNRVHWLLAAQQSGTLSGLLFPSLGWESEPLSNLHRGSLPAAEALALILSFWRDGGGGKQVEGNRSDCVWQQPLHALSHCLARLHEGP